MLWCTLLGLLVPMALILRWKLLRGSIFGTIWPSSYDVLGLEGPTSRPALDIIAFYAIVIAINVIFYAVVGFSRVACNPHPVGPTQSRR
jgi:hypothetical protein